MHVLRMLIKLASLVHKCSGEEHFLALWNLARRGARVFTSSSPDSACWKEGSWNTCSDEFRCKNSSSSRLCATGRRYCVLLRPHYAVSEPQRWKESCLQKRNSSLRVAVKRNRITEPSITPQQPACSSTARRHRRDGVVAFKGNGHLGWGEARRSRSPDGAKAPRREHQCMCCVC